MMRLAEQLGLKALRKIDPEQAHGLALRALQMGLASAPGTITSARLKCEVAGLALPNPVGLAAGFDKNAEALRGLSKSGFGFVEVGAATPRAQDGNPKPRLFRLMEDKAAINRFGFNNQGMEAIGARLSMRPKGMVLGLNLGANKDSDDRAQDFAKVLRHCGAHVDFATVNVSSPNTEKLRDLLRQCLEQAGADLARRIVEEVASRAAHLEDLCLPMHPPDLLEGDRSRGAPDRHAARFEAFGHIADTDRAYVLKKPLRWRIGCGDAERSGRRR